MNNFDMIVISEEKENILVVMKTSEPPFDYLAEIEASLREKHYIGVVMLSLIHIQMCIRDRSGMGQYAVVKFHLEELRKFDQAGVAAFCNQHGLQKTMQEERRQSR